MELIVLNQGGDFKITYDDAKNRLRIDTVSATKPELKELMVLVRKAKTEGSQKVYEANDKWSAGKEVKELKPDKRYVMFQGPKDSSDLINNFESFLKTKEKMNVTLINGLGGGIKVATKPIKHGC